MKKEIMKIIANGEGEFYLNGFCKIWAETHKGFGSDGDITNVYAHFKSDVGTFVDYRIESRDYEGIISEVQMYTEQYLDSIKNKLIKSLKAGYIVPSTE